MEEKNHPATDRHRHQFRERGEVPVSKDLNSLAVLAGGAATLVFFGGMSGRVMVEFCASVMGGGSGIDDPNWAGRAANAFSMAAGPTLVACAASALLVGFLQTRWNLSSEALKIDLTRLNPLPKLRSMLGSLEAMGNLAMSVVKVSVVGVVCGTTVYDELPALLLLRTDSLGNVMGAGGMVMLTLMFRGSMAILVLAVADYGVQWFKQERKMRMTTQQVRDDQKEESGDPYTRARRKKRHRELVQQRSLKEVPHADVVVTNPTHYAVALLYTAGKMGAPRVISKGKDAVAERIRAIARRAGVPVISQPPLTRALYRRVDTGRDVPADLFQAVAIILAHVYKLRRRVA